MYFAIAYEFWPKLVGREPLSLKPIRLQLWMWAIGMVVTTFPWHVLGLEGQPRRVATFDYTNPMIAYWQHWTIVSMIGGYILLTAGLLFIWNLLTLYHGAQADRRMHYAVAVYPPHGMCRAI